MFKDSFNSDQYFLQKKVLLLLLFLFLYAISNKLKVYAKPKVRWDQELQLFSQVLLLW